ncbi:unnamed protein product, partial [marine sediment metagenome]
MQGIGAQSISPSVSLSLCKCIASGNTATKTGLNGQAIDGGLSAQGFLLRYPSGVTL